MLFHSSVLMSEEEVKCPEEMAVPRIAQLKDDFGCLRVLDDEIN